jgi:hypothetical protein
VSAPFILSWPELIKPKAFTPKGGGPLGEPEFSIEGISEKDSLGKWNLLDRETGEFTLGNVEARLVQLARERWGADYDAKGRVASGELTWPFKNGDKKAEKAKGKGDHYRGKKSWRGHAKPEINGRPNAPSLYEADGNGELIAIPRSTEEGRRRIEELFYAGAICTAELNAVAMVAPTGKDTITLYLNSVVFEQNGPKLGGGSNIERLRGVKGGQSNIDPSAGMGEELDDQLPD